MNVNRLVATTALCFGLAGCDDEALTPAPGGLDPSDVVDGCAEVDGRRAVEEGFRQKSKTFGSSWRHAA